MRIKLHSSIVYKGMKYVVGDTVDVEQKDVEEIQGYGVLIDTMPCKPLQDDIKDDNTLDNVEVTKEVKEPKKRTTTTKRATKKASTK